MLKSLLSLLCLAALTLTSARADPLRVFIRAGKKTHGPGQHDHPRFLEEWTKLLNQRGARVSGAMDWPSAEELNALDVIVVFAPDPWDVTPAQKVAITKYAERGGAFVVLHDGICSRKDPDWVRSLLGGSWKYGTAKWFEGDLSYYYVNNDDPIVVGASNFDLKDELYYNLDFEADIKVLAATWTPDERAKQNGRAFPHIYDVAPQIWTYEKDNSRAFVDLLGHEYETFNLPQVRAVLLRGLAWAGRREKIDEFCTKEELASLRYPPGGPTRPADALSKLVVHPEFNMSLVAAEPLIDKPIAIDWDPAGRLWLAETVEYPNGRRGMKPALAGNEWKDHGGLVAKTGVQDREAHDRISYLVDTKGHGVADEKKVFYEGLELVTGFVLYRDGVIASAAPDIFFLRDTDGDGKADKVEKLYTGLGTRDTHAVINNLRWGFDGWIYATHGYSSTEDVTSGDGQKHFGRLGSGVVRFKPDGSAIEQYSSKGGNTWGLAITAGNEVIWTQPTSGDLVMETVLPETALARGKYGETTSYKIITKSPKSFPLLTHEQQAYRQIDFVGSFTAAAGCAIYDGGSWPAKYNGSYFCTEPTINIVHHEFLEPEATSFRGIKEPGRETTEFVTARDLWFRPIETRIGPDGALYVLDFYNQAVIHNDTRGPDHNNVNAAVRPDRDHYFGRVWRIDHKEARKNPVPDLTKAAPEKLIAALSHPSKAVRTTAQRLLLELPPGEAWTGVRQLALDEKGDPYGRVHALWALADSQQLTREILDSALTQDTPLPVVRQALAAASFNAIPAEDFEAQKKSQPSQAPKDENGQAAVPFLPAEATVLQWMSTGDDRARLAAVRALESLGVSPAGAQALQTLAAKSGDRFVLSAIQGIATGRADRYIEAALFSGPAEPPPQWLEVLENVAGYLPVKLPRWGEGKLSSLASYGSYFMSMLAREGAAPAASSAVLRGLARHAAELAPTFWPPALRTELQTLLTRPGVSEAALPLVLAWDAQGLLRETTKPMIERLIPRLANEKTPEAERASLIPVLLSARKVDGAALPAVAAILGSKASVKLQKEALVQLGNTGDPAAGALLIAAYSRLAAPLPPVAFAQILKRAEWVAAFVAALEQGQIPLANLGPLAMDKLRHYPDAATAALASKALDKLRGPVTKEKDKLVASLLPAVESGGDAAKGKILFTTTCGICHRFNNEGATLAPELTGMGAHPRAELLTHIVDPNREVDPSFFAYDFVMKNGDTFQGIVASENPRSVLVRDPAGEHTLQKNAIVSRHDIGRSLMPEGFEGLGAENLRDLLAYIQSGDSRFRVLDLRKYYTADSRKGLFASQEQTSDTLRFKKMGNVRVGDVPFFIADASVVPSGKNLIVLRGGSGFAKTYPKKVEIAVDRLEANTLLLLGGVGGWAYPCCGDEKSPDLPVAKLTVVYEDNSTEEFVYKNGEEIADFMRPHDVPGSKSAAELVQGQQVRVIQQKLAKSGTITKLILESFDTRVAPLFVAITAEKNEGGAPATAENPK